MMPAKPMSMTQQEKYLNDFKTWVDSVNSPTQPHQQRYIDQLTNTILDKQMRDMLDQGHAMTNAKQDDEVTNQNVFTENEVNYILLVKYRAKSMCDESFLYTLYEDNLVIAGGCFASWMNGEDARDIDVFVVGSLEDQVKIKKTIQDTQPDLEDVSDYRRDNDKIIGVYNNKKTKVQFIFTQYKTREELIDHFDFVHCKVSYYKGKLFINRDTYNSIRDMKLVPNQSNRIAQWRVEKFVSRGWKMPDGYHAANKSVPTGQIPPAGTTGPWSGARINPMRGNWAAATNAITDPALEKLIADLAKAKQTPWTA